MGIMRKLKRAIERKNINQNEDEMICSECGSEIIDSEECESKMEGIEITDVEWKTEWYMITHINDEIYDCEHCIDKKADVCPGQDRRGKKEVRECMEKQAECSILTFHG
jgi:hypothetical protein